MVELLLGLVVVHFLCDYPLQGDFVARGKNRHTAIPGVPWYHPMLAHSAIHGGGVAVVTGYWQLGVLEAICHFGIDCLKCEGQTSLTTDQILHLTCKALWVAMMAAS